MKISITDEKLPSFKETKMSKEVKKDSERKDSYYTNEKNKNKRYYSTKVKEKKIIKKRKDLPQIPLPWILKGHKYEGGNLRKD